MSVEAGQLIGEAGRAVTEYGAEHPANFTYTEMSTSLILKVRTTTTYSYSTEGLIEGLHGALFWVGAGLQILPNQYRDFQNGSAWNVHTADLMIDAGIVLLGVGVAFLLPEILAGAGIAAVGTAASIGATAVVGAGVNIVAGLVHDLWVGQSCKDK